MRSLYFGCLHDIGHFLHDSDGRKRLYAQELAPTLPWEWHFLDSGILRNRKIPDAPDGRVHWTCGGRPSFWHAFVWWDRSIDTRPASNSGLYVCVGSFPGVEGLEAQRQEAFEHAKRAWPSVVARQRHPLVLQPPP